MSGSGNPASNPQADSHPQPCPDLIPQPNPVPEANQQPQKSSLNWDGEADLHLYQILSILKPRSPIPEPILSIICKTLNRMNNLNATVADVTERINYLQNCKESLPSDCVTDQP